MTISIFAFKQEFIGKILLLLCFSFLGGGGDIILCLFVIFAIYHFGFEDRVLVLIVTVPGFEHDLLQFLLYTNMPSEWP